MLKETIHPPRISVIIPVFNGEEYLLEAVQSIIKQEFNEIEIIIVDDGSTDRTCHIIEQLKVGFPIRYFYQKNKGPSFARNVGIENAIGEWICFIDSDDIWPENKIKSILEYLEKNEGIDILWGMTKFFFETENLKSKYYGTEIVEKAIFNTYLGSAFIRKTVFEEVGNFDISLKYCEDLDWYLRALEKKVKLKKRETIDLFYRVHANNSTQDLFSMNKNLIRMLKNKINRK
jgi:glycosyltransferase involved in cell wall biosynthesis